MLSILEIRECKSEILAMQYTVVNIVVAKNINNHIVELFRVCIIFKCRSKRSSVLNSNSVIALCVSSFI